MFTAEIKNEIINHLNPNPFGWKNSLNESQISKIKVGTQDIWPDFYSSSDW